MTPAPWRALACAVGVALAPAASAVELARAQDDGWVLEGSGFFKPYASWVLLPPALVESTKELDRVFDETRALVPPERAADVPSGFSLPSQVGLATQTLRLQSRLVVGDGLDMEVAWQAAAIITSSPAFGAGSTQAGVLGTQLLTAGRRLVDFDPFLIDEDGFRLQHNLDRVVLRWHTDAFTLAVGRQALSWGTGRLWNPTDLLSPFAPTDVDREVRRGADAVRVSLPINVVSELELLWLPQQQLHAQGFVVRVRSNLWDTDVSTTVAKYVDDLVLGADFSGDLGQLGVHGEAAWTLPVRGSRAAVSGQGVQALRVEDDFIRAVAGLDWRPAEAFVLGAEYYFNGFGTDDPARIVDRLSDERVVRGEVFGAGRHYVGLVASWLASDLLSVSASAIVNVTDPGVLVVPAVEYWFEQSVLLRAGGFVPAAQGVDVDLFRALGPADVLGNSAAFQTATTTLGARSEFGLSPAGAFIQLGAYVN